MLSSKFEWTNYHILSLYVLLNLLFPFPIKSLRSEKDQSYATNLDSTFFCFVIFLPIFLAFFVKKLPPHDRILSNAQGGKNCNYRKKIRGIQKMSPIKRAFGNFLNLSFSPFKSCSVFVFTSKAFSIASLFLVMINVQARLLFYDI